GGGLSGARRYRHRHRRGLRSTHRDAARAVQRRGLNRDKTMRRGLMGWDAQELPEAALDARRERLRAAMARAGLDALLLYTNIVRPSAVCWLTGFTPYWIESLLLVARDSTPMLASARSKSVAAWHHATTRIADIDNTLKPGPTNGARLAAAAGQRASVL